jgi:hypothetical protein
MWGGRLRSYVRSTPSPERGFTRYVFYVRWTLPLRRDGFAEVADELVWLFPANKSARHHYTQANADALLALATTPTLQLALFLGFLAADGSIYADGELGGAEAKFGRRTGVL